MKNNDPEFEQRRQANWDKARHWILDLLHSECPKDVVEKYINSFKNEDQFKDLAHAVLAIQCIAQRHDDGKTAQACEDVLFAIPNVFFNRSAIYLDFYRSGSDWQRELDREV